MTAEIKRIRIGTDIRMRVNFMVDGAPVSWDDMKDVSFWLISEVQRTRHDDVEAEHGGNPDDIYVTWRAGRQIYLGRYRLAVSFSRGGRVYTFDTPAFELLPSSEGAGSFDYDLITENGLYVTTEGDETQQITVSAL